MQPDHVTRPEHPRPQQLPTTSRATAIAPGGLKCVLSCSVSVQLKYVFVSSTPSRCHSASDSAWTSSSATRSASASARMAAGYSPCVGTAFPSASNLRRSTGVANTGRAPFARAPSTYIRR